MFVNKEQSYNKNQFGHHGPTNTENEGLKLYVDKYLEKSVKKNKELLDRLAKL